MVDLTNVQFPPPANWQDFESLSRDLFAAIWCDPTTQRNGRQGQAQHGVDVFGIPSLGDQYAGVQCKGKATYFGQIVTEAELSAEVEKAKSFIPPLKSFTLVTTARNDQAIQAHARKLTIRNRKDGFFDVEVMGWDEIQARLAQFPEIARVHYAQFFPPPEPPMMYIDDARVFGGALSAAILDTGAARYTQATAHFRTLLPKHGAFEAALVIPNARDYVADRHFLDAVTKRKPTRWSGWSLWMNPQALRASEVQPYVSEEGWEAQVVLLDDKKWSSRAIDFWRIWPLGRLYHRRGFWEDDLMPVAKLPGFEFSWPNKTPVGREFDPAFQILHVAEALEAGVILANQMQNGATQEKLDFSFRWSGLRGRELHSRFRPGIYSLDRLLCVDEVVTSQCFIPASTAISELPALTFSVTARLLRAFNGFVLEKTTVETLVREFLDL